jgi:hypothetical protein
MNRILFFCLFSLQTFIGFSQVQKANAHEEQNMFFKKNLYGFSFNNSWTGFYDIKDTTFIKPGLGLQAEYNYFFTNNYGVSVQAGIQMRGTGIITPDYDKTVGNPDSTGRMRHNIRTFEMPVVFYYRPNREIIKNGRMIFGLGFIPMYHAKVMRKWYSVDDGFHIETSYKQDFATFDIPIRLSSGLDINVAGNNLFRSVIIMDIGLKNNYKDPLDGKKSQKHFLLGIQLTFLL